MPSWYAQRDKIKTVVFDASFANARPTSCYRWFCYCYNLTTIEGIEYLNTEKVTNMKDMFYRCSALTSLDLSNFNTAEVKDMTEMFCSCSALTTIFVSDKFVTGQVTSSVDMFSGCDKLIGAIKYVEKNTNNKDYANYETGYFAPEGGFPGYAVFDGGTGTLTFRSGPSTSKPERAYDLNVGTSLPGWLAQRENIKTVVFDASFANARLTNCYAWFYGCNNLTTIEGIEYLNTENVTNMGGMFYNCCALTSLNLTSFNTAKVESMSCMFYNCSALTSLDLSNFNTAKVTNMEEMFIGCSALTTIYVSDKFVTDKVTDSRNMFSGCNKLIGAIEYDGSKSDHTYANYDNGYFSPEGGFHAYAEFNNATGTLTFSRGLSKPVGAYDLNEGDVQPAWSNQSAKINKVVFDASFANARPTSCYMWFYRCENLTKIEDIENLNTQNVTDMSWMFYRCDGLTSLDVSHFNTQKVEDMSEMFSVCSGLKSLNVSHFDTQNVKDMNSMFYSCERLTSLDVSNFNTQNVTDMRYMFSWCEGLNSLDLSKFYTQNVEYMNNMFWSSSALKTIYVSDKFVTTKVSSGGDMFKGCTSLKGAIDYVASKTDYTYANYNTGYFTLKPSTAYAVFNKVDGTLTFRYDDSKPAGAYDLKEGDVRPAWNDEQSTNINKVVFDASFAKARPTSCYMWFYSCENLTKIEDIENLNTQNVTDMSYMFYSCERLTSLDVSNFNTQNVTDMSYMFSWCEGLNSLDLSKFDTQNVEYMNYMFWSSSALKTIYVSDKFVTTKVSYGTDMFSGCTSLKGAIDFDDSKTDKTYANYKTGYFTKLVGKNGNDKIGAVGEVLTAESLALADDKDFEAYEPFAAKAASYSRKIKEGTTWGTLCLPFAIDQSKETGCKFYRLTGIDNECITLESYEEGIIPAGTPVLFKMNENEQTLSISTKDASIVKEPVAGTNTDVNLVGSFTKIGGNGNQGLAEYDYIIGKDKFWRVSDLNDGNGVGIKPMRAYIHPATASQARAAMLSIGKGDGTTAIDNLNAISNDANAEYYDANGRRTNGLQKGLNIVKRGSKTYKIMVK
nr:BspA family leucine-rich repeat surface protein [Segatella copri]